MSRAVRFYEFIKVGNSIILFDVRVLKCQLEESSNSLSSELSCKWFQMKHWKEVLSLLAPKIEYVENIKLDRISPKSIKTEILTGSLVKVAYCFRDSYHPERRILTPKRFNQSIPRSDCLDGGLETQTLCRTKVVISVCNLMTNAIQDIEKLFRAISQPSIQTVENTIEISHYFNRQSKENRPDSLSDENNKCDTMNNVIPTPPQKAVLRKVVREGLQNEKNRRRTRLKRKCAAIRNGESESSSVNSNEERHREVDDIKGARKTQSVKSLTLKQIEERFWMNQQYILSISRGEVNCRRHQDYMLGGAKRKDLDFQVNLSFYSEAQVQHTMALLRSLFAPKEYEMLDYVLKVLLPEFLIKVYMDVKGLTHEETEQKMHSRNIDD